MAPHCPAKATPQKFDITVVNKTPNPSQGPEGGNTGVCTYTLGGGFSDKYLPAGKTGMVHVKCTQSEHQVLDFKGTCSETGKDGENVSIGFCGGTRALNFDSQVKTHMRADIRGQHVTFTMDSQCHKLPTPAPAPSLPACASATAYQPCGGGQTKPDLWQCTGPPLKDGASCPKAPGSTCEQTMNGPKPSGYWMCTPSK